MRLQTFSYNSYLNINEMFLLRFKSKEKIKRKDLINAKSYSIKEHLSIHKTSSSKDAKIRVVK